MLTCASERIFRNCLTSDESALVSCSSSFVYDSPRTKQKWVQRQTHRRPDSSDQSMTIPTTMTTMEFKSPSATLKRAHRSFHRADKTVERPFHVRSRLERSFHAPPLSSCIPAGPVIPPKPQATRGVDLDAQGVINGQPTYEHDLLNAYKDDEKPWKKPGWTHALNVQAAMPSTRSRCGHQ